MTGLIIDSFAGGGGASTGMKLGSLFDGSGGFPLAGAIHGISPAWAAEIEPYPIRVTKARFPQMKHLGSVLDVNGAEVEPVDIITFGSPCQDLSVAGKQAGLQDGTRSNLFYEAIRIIKEMRRSTDGIYPRIAVWENVPGAYSSNKGEDFRAVLQAFCSVKDEAADVPRPAAGKWNSAGAIVGNGWSIAWRTFDAQYWGVPQRRKRIYLIADFGSERSGEILFEQEGLRGHFAESGTAGEGAADNAEGSVGRGVQCLNPSMPQSSRIYSADGVYPCLSANETGGLNRQAVLFEPMSALEENWAESSVKNALRAGESRSSHAVCHPIDLIRESRGAFEAYDEDAKIGGSLKQSDNKGSQVVCYPINTMVATRWKADDERTTFGIGDNGDPQFTIGAAHEHAVCYALDRASFNQGINAKYDICIEPELNSPLVARGPSAVCYPVENHPNDSRVSIREDGIVPTLSSRMGTGVNNGPMVLETTKPPRKYIIRRLTPLECLRLQGLPDGWLDGVDGSDSAKYKMLGNGIAMPNAIYVVGCAVQLLQEGKHENEG